MKGNKKIRTLYTALAAALACLLAFSGCSADLESNGFKTPSDPGKSSEPPSDPPGGDPVEDPPDDPPEEPPEDPPADRPGTFPGLSAAAEEQIKADFYYNLLCENERADTAIDSVFISAYFGNYNGSEAVSIGVSGAPHPGGLTTFAAAGLQFVLSSPHAALLWRQEGGPGSGRFFTLGEAFETGLLSEGEILAMHERLYGRAAEGLDLETQWRIKLDYWNGYLPAGERPSGTADDLRIHYYFGNYSGFEVVVFLRNIPALVGSQQLHEDIIIGVTFDSGQPQAGARFIFPRPAHMLAWKQGAFYGMQEAFDLGLLLQEDIQKMSDMYSGKEFEPLDAETENQIKDAVTDMRLYLGPLHNNWYSFRYLGEYNGYVIFFIFGNAATTTEIFLKSNLFFYSISALMLAWDVERKVLIEFIDGYFTSLGTPIEHIHYGNFLTDEDVQSMYVRYYYYYFFKGVRR